MAISRQTCTTKKILVTITGLIILHVASNAQYSIYKDKYDYRTYTYQMGDPYKPSQMSICSVIIPGLGQLIEGESIRGLAFLGGSIALAIFKMREIWRPGVSFTESNAIRNSVLIGQIGLRVWSGINASRIAKVNDLAFRDKYNSTVNLKILPYSGILDYYGFCKTGPVGITLLVSF